MWGWQLGLMFAMVMANSVLAAFEIALASVTLGRLQVLKDQHRRGAKAAVHMKDNMESSLAVVQLGITLVGAVAAAVGGAGAEDSLSPLIQQSWHVSGVMADVLAIVFIVAPLTVVTIVFGELVPKVFALKNAEWMVCTLAPAMFVFTICVWPAVWLLETATTLVTDFLESLWFRGTGKKSEGSHLQELRAIATLARSSRLITAREEKIIVSAAKFSSRTIKEIMLPAKHISMMSSANTLSECLIAAHMDMHTRFPVTERSGDPQGIVGYVNFKDIVSVLRTNPRNPSLRAILRPILSFDDDTYIAVCLERMIHEHSHIALVRSDEGQVIGMITMEDIVEELIGEIEDEHDKLPNHVVGYEDSWVVGGGVDLARLRELTGVDLTTDLPEPHVRKLTEWVTGHLGKAVTGGEIVERPGFRVVVRKSRRQQVQEAQVSLIEKEEEETSEEAGTPVTDEET
jgi:putative hemolysin